MGMSLEIRTTFSGFVEAPVSSRRPSLSGGAVCPPAVQELTRMTNARGNKRVIVSAMRGGLAGVACSLQLGLHGISGEQKQAEQQNLGRANRAHRSGLL